jgi:hypothetical protein
MRIRSFIQDHTGWWNYKQHQDVAQTLNGGVEFGGPNQVSTDNPSGSINISGSWVDTTTPGVANTEFTVTHNLGRIPVGILVVSVDKAAIIYASRRADWTKTQLFLKSDQATVALVGFVI